MASSVTLGGGRLACRCRDPGSVRPIPRHCLVKCEAQNSGKGCCQPVSAVKAILPGLLAAALLHSSAANAGVVFKKPEQKRVFEGGKQLFKGGAPKEEGSGSSGPSLPSFSAPSLPSFSLPGLPTPSLPGPPSLPGVPSLPTPKAPEIGLDIRYLSIPASIGFVAVLAFLGITTDSKFGDFLSEGLVKDSSPFTGYEEDPLQARGSPQGFLGLGNLFEDAGPGAKTVAKQAKKVAGTQPRSPFQGKGTGLPKPFLGKGQKPAGAKGGKASGKKKGLFK